MQLVRRYLPGAINQKLNDYYTHPYHDHQHKKEYVRIVNSIINKQLKKSSDEIRKYYQDITIQRIDSYLSTLCGDVKRLLVKFIYSADARVVVLLHDDYYDGSVGCFMDDERLQWFDIWYKAVIDSIGDSNLITYMYFIHKIHTEKHCTKHDLMRIHRHMIKQRGPLVFVKTHIVWKYNMSDKYIDCEHDELQIEDYVNYGLISRDVLDKYYANWRASSNGSELPRILKERDLCCVCSCQRTKISRDKLRYCTFNGADPDTDSDQAITCTHCGDIGINEMPINAIWYYLEVLDDVCGDFIVQIDSPTHDIWDHIYNARPTTCTSVDMIDDYRNNVNVA
jgi:hypothetical protein